jgi:hypothetical protein
VAFWARIPNYSEQSKGTFIDCDDTITVTLDGGSVNYYLFQPSNNGNGTLTYQVSNGALLLNQWQSYAFSYVSSN